MRKNLLALPLLSALILAVPAHAQGGHSSECRTAPAYLLFDPDSDTLSPSARAELEAVAQAYRKCGQGSLVIAGHTDRVASADYNVGLSQRMASNARAFLAGAGVPEGVMTTAAFGESRPMIETEDGVSEPYNRRVEITFGPGSGW